MQNQGNKMLNCCGVCHPIVLIYPFEDAVTWSTAAHIPRFGHIKLLQGPAVHLALL